MEWEEYTTETKKSCVKYSDMYYPKIKEVDIERNLLSSVFFSNEKFEQEFYHTKISVRKRNPGDGYLGELKQ